MDEYHGLGKIAVEDLLKTCPEFLHSWNAKVWLLRDDDGGVGMYGVFGQIILPFLIYALSIGPRSESNPSEIGNHMETEFRRNSMWRDIPDSKSPQFEDLLRRLYQVLERWADSPNRHIREAVFIEMVEIGYGSLSVDDLTNRAGPILQSLKNKHPRQTSRSESSNEPDGIS